MGTKIVALSELCKISGRVGWKGYTVDDLREDGPLVIGANDIDSNHQLDLKEVKHISREKYEESPEIMIDKYDILIVKVGSTIGKVAIVDQDLGEACINPNTVLLKNCRINPFYIYYTLISSYGQSFLLNNSSASAQPALNQTTLKEMPIHLPADENRIDNITKSLNRINTKIKLNNKINCELEAMAKLIYDYWFVQFDFPNEQGKPYKSSGGKMVYNSEMKREIPEGWEVKKLNKLFVFDKGTEPGSSEYCEEKLNTNFVKFYRVGDIHSESNGIKYVDAKINDYHFVNERDVLVTFDGSVGKLGYGLKGAYSSGLCNIYDKTNTFDNSLVYFIFKDERIIATIHKYATGSILLHASSSINHLTIPYNEKHYLLFQKYVKSNFDLMVKNKIENQQLSELKDWLLPMLMNGQVTVQEAEVSLNMAAEPSVEYSIKLK